MLFFAVPHCAVKACLNWRAGDKCAKHQSPITTKGVLPITTQPADICTVRVQLNMAKVQNLLEET